MVYERMIAEKQRIEKELNLLEKKLDEFPEGKIFCTHHGKYYKWYHSDGKKQTYISKEKRHYAEQLAAKKYLSACQEELLQEKKAIEKYLYHHNLKFSKKKQFLLTDPAYQELLSPYFKPVSQELFSWANSPYDQNNNYPEQKNQRTSSGNMVRSKSEALIDMMLYINLVPFRYECILKIGSIVLYPDFTIRHPETGEYFYWEHFGRMDDFAYAKGAISKLQLYISNNYIPSINLITTFETAQKPLSGEVVEKIVKDYFL